MLPFFERVLSALRIDYLPSHNRGIPVPKNPMTIGGHLRKKRLQLRLFQSEAASRLKVSTVTLSRCECDKAYPAWQYQIQAEHFLKVLENGSVSTNIYLRRVHNFALDMNWLPWPVLPKKRWPAIKFKEKRGITWEEHQAIVARELNPERKAFYQLAWHLGAAQSDIAFLEAKTLIGSKTSSAFAKSTGC